MNKNNLIIVLRVHGLGIQEEKLFYFWFYRKNIFFKKSAACSETLKIVTRFQKFRKVNAKILKTAAIL